MCKVSGLSTIFLNSRYGREGTVNSEPRLRDPPGARLLHFRGTVVSLSKLALPIRHLVRVGALTQLLSIASAIELLTARVSAGQSMLMVMYTGCIECDNSLGGGSAWSDDLDSLVNLRTNTGRLLLACLWPIEHRHTSQD